MVGAADYVQYSTINRGYVWFMVYTSSTSTPISIVQYNTRTWSYGWGIRTRKWSMLMALAALFCDSTIERADACIRHVVLDCVSHPKSFEKASAVTRASARSFRCRVTGLLIMMALHEQKRHICIQSVWI